MAQMLMNLSKRLLILLLIIGLVGSALSACALNPNDSQTTPISPLPEPETHITDYLPQPSGQASTGQNNPSQENPLYGFKLPENLPIYNLDIILNYYSQYADITQSISYTNKTGSPLKDLLLRIPPKYFPETYDQKSLTINPPATQTEQGLSTILTFNDPLMPDQQVRINLQYRLVMPKFTRDDGAWTFGASDQQTNLTNFYPYIPPYLPGTGWLVYDPVYDAALLPVGENVVNETANFEVRLRLTDRPELIEVAASAPMIGVERSGDYRYNLELARGFSLSVSDSYFINEVTEAGVTVRSYSFYNNQQTGKDVLELGMNAVKLYGELFYPYPRPLVSIVVADFQHNMEMDGMVMLSYGVFDFYKGPKTNLAMLAPHEIAHQWFYSQVGNDQAKEPWLDEAICIYTELLYYERYYPDLVSWWWRNRVQGWQPSGYVNSDIQTPGGYEPYRLAVYLRGAIFMQDLRDTIGDEAFFAALKDYASANTYKIATAADFFAALSRHSTTNFQPVVAKYFKQ